MSVKTPIRTHHAAQLIQCPPARQPKPADPCAMVIFGASGDLTKRLVIPALYNLSRTKVLPEKFALIGVARTPGTSESWRDHVYDTLKSFVGNPVTEFDVDHIDEAAWKRLAEKMSYIQGDLTKPELYETLRGALDDAEKAHGTEGNVIFYLAVADRLFGTVVDQLGNAKLTDQNEDQNGKQRFWRRVVIEKPFGHSLDSARKLNAQILRTLHEDQIFRIDHFLGKDTVQSIMAFRFGNGLFEPIWNRDRIDHVQITAAETVGVEQPRGVLRGDRRPARHGPQSCVLIALDGGHGAPDWLRCPRNPYEEGRSACRNARRRTGMRCARPIRGRQGAGQEGQGLSARARCGDRFRTSKPISP